MKHTIKTRTEFQPIEVNITIESLDELKNLVARLEIYDGDLIKHINRSCIGVDGSYKLWGKLSDILCNTLQTLK
jgi:hypothetical protein